jgi:hypothetical protein
MSLPRRSTLSIRFPEDKLTCALYEFHASCKSVCGQPPACSRSHLTEKLASLSCADGRDSGIANVATTNGMEAHSGLLHTGEKHPATATKIPGQPINAPGGSMKPHTTTCLMATVVAALSRWSLHPSGATGVCLDPSPGTSVVSKDFLDQFRTLIDYNRKVATLALESSFQLPFELQARPFPYDRKISTTRQLTIHRGYHLPGRPISQVLPAARRPVHRQTSSGRSGLRVGPSPHHGSPSRHFRDPFGTLS